MTLEAVRLSLHPFVTSRHGVRTTHARGHRIFTGSSYIALAWKGEREGMDWKGEEGLAYSRRLGLAKPKAVRPAVYSFAL